MIHLWNLKNEELILNVKEILSHKELALLYQRDTTKDKRVVRQQLLYVDRLVNRDGYAMLNGLNKKDAHLYAATAAGLPPAFKPDKLLEQVIFRVRELNGGIVENTYDNAISTLRMMSSGLIRLKEFMEDLEEKLATPDDVEKLITLMVKVDDISGKIPTRIKTYLKHKAEYDAIKAGNALGRGGIEITDSFEGGGIEDESDNGDVEVIE